MEKIINRLIDEAVVNVDKYVNNNSTWLIFTESKQWVIELTKEGTLWYNYNFFKNLFVYMSMDVVENQHYITKWVEDNIINGVKHLRHRKGADDSRAENIIQNGVKEAKPMEGWVNSQKIVDKTIQNGVKETELHKGNRPLVINDTIKNGVKETRSVEEGTFTSIGFGVHVEETIQNVVKDTRWMSDWLDNKVENTIQNGVKHTIDTTHHKNKYVEDAIENGVKQTQASIFASPTAVKDTIQNGIRHVEIGWAQYNNVEDVIKGGVKETKGLGPSEVMEKEINDAIQNGVKETKNRLNRDRRIVEDTIQNGIKETKGGGYLGSITMGGKLVHMVESPNQNNEVEDVIQHGVIETFDETHHRRREVVRTIRDGIKQTCAQIPSIDAVVERVVEEGIKETHDDVYHHTTRVDGVIRNGIKEVKELPDMSGELRGYGDYYRRQKDMAKPHILYVKDVIENGNKDALKKSTY